MLISFLLNCMPILKIKAWKIITMVKDIQSIIFKPNKKIRKISWSKRELSIEKIEIRIRYPKTFDKKYVWIPNIKIPTAPLIKPKKLAPLNPKDVLKRTANGNPNFCEGLPIKFEKNKPKLNLE